MIYPAGSAHKRLASMYEVGYDLHVPARRLEQLSIRGEMKFRAVTQMVDRSTNVFAMYGIGTLMGKT